MSSFNDYLSQGDRGNRLIADYGLIGDCETAALVHTSGVVDWLCWPRFDSEACFAGILGGADNGCWWLGAAGRAKRTRRYRDNTLILETTVETESGTARVIDFMPIRGEASDVIRIARGISGAVEFAGHLAVRFGYGRARPVWRRIAPGRAVATSKEHAVRIVSDDALDVNEDGDITWNFLLRAGDSRAFILTTFSAAEKEPADVDPVHALRETEQYWSSWIARCSYRGRAREAVLRSLATIKAATHRPTGGIIAAPTSSLPELKGGRRNWDYRFCWLRDATFVLLALLHTGYEEEAVAWREWLLRTVGDDPEQLQPIYGLAGERQLAEWEAPWLSGFNGAQPVRFGNVVHRQRQFDTYGEVVDTLYQAHVHRIPAKSEALHLQTRLVEHLEKVWDQPDHGIWETRLAPRRFTHSQVMIWVALSRLIDRARHAKLNAPLARWEKLRRQIHAEICARGFDAERNSFVQAFDSPYLDASLLLIPQLGVLPADDPRIVGTIDAIGRDLGCDGFIRRYDPESGIDDLPGPEGAFLPCSFWYADALIMTGRRDEAEKVFEHALSACNDLGLLAEEYDPATHELRGNFPQALSHVALVNTALNLYGETSPAHHRGGSPE